MSKRTILTIEADLALENAPLTRVLLDGKPIGAIQLLEFSQGNGVFQGKGALPAGQLVVYDVGQQEELIKQLEACPWLKVTRIK